MICHSCKREIPHELIEERKKLKGQRVSDALKKRREAGGLIGPKPRFIGDIKERIIFLHQMGESIRKIAKIIGCSNYTVYTIISKWSSAKHNE